MESKLPYSFGVEINAISALSIIFGNELQTSFCIHEEIHSVAF